MGPYCNESTWIEKEIYFPANAKRLIFNVSAGYAGGDGVQLNTYIGGALFNSTLVSSNFSGSISINLNIAGVHLLRLEPSKYGICSYESIKIREIKFG